MKRLAALLLLAAACSDSTGPRNALAGRYDLSTINGATLPTRYGTTSCAPIIASATLVFGAITAGSVTYRDQAIWAPCASSTAQSDTLPGAVTFRGDSVYITTPGDGSAMRGVVSSDRATLTMRGTLVGTSTLGDADLVFVLEAP